MLNRLIKITNLINSKGIFTKNIALFSKEAPKKEGGKKQDPKNAAPPVPQIEQPSLQSLVVKWLQPQHNSLSPSQLKYYNQGFDDISASNKEILNDFAERLLELHTATFYDLNLKKGVFGTSQMLYTVVEDIPEGEIVSKVRALRKQA